MTTREVLDLGSNLPENLERWAKVLGPRGTKLEVFKVVYSGKRKRWTAKEISLALGNRVTPKRVTECGKSLVGAGLVSQLASEYPIVYEKIGSVHYHKRKLLIYALDRSKLRTIPTKRNSHLTVNIAQRQVKKTSAQEIFVDDVAQFSKVQKIGRYPRMLPPISETRFKAGLKSLFGETGEFKDWPGERRDFYTNKLLLAGKRHTAAFALKGPGVGVKKVTPGKWGKHGNQIQKLVGSPASVFFLQFEGEIDEYSIEQLKDLVEYKSHKEGRRLYYGCIDRVDSLRLRLAYPRVFKP